MTPPGPLQSITHPCFNSAMKKAFRRMSFSGRSPSSTSPPPPSTNSDDAPSLIKSSMPFSSPSRLAEEALDSPSLKPPIGRRATVATLQRSELHATHKAAAETFISVPRAAGNGDNEDNCFAEVRRPALVRALVRAYNCCWTPSLTLLAKLPRPVLELARPFRLLRALLRLQEDVKKR